ncbi:BppU family phage baseplate upper protein [Bacillus paranthracis]|uniref:BppU family phage baseplate upper protein n=1 Tax=Bacillus paranthracis TaxID=2026186 RepID=UPI0039F65AE8
MRFYQNDLNSAKLLINVTHDKVVTDFSTATKVQIAFLKPDGKRVFQDVQNVNQMQGKYYVVLSTQTLIAYGNVVAQLRLTFPDNKVIETCKFVFAVDESIMSDEAMKSTNEFPVIQKAIEAGKKLEGVDINGIIAAGELAKGALPKTGGTMTGILDINNNVPFGFKAASGSRAFDFYVASSNIFNLRHVLLNKNIFTVDGNGVFNVTTDTNLLKTTGGTMTGNLEVRKGIPSVDLVVDDGSKKVRLLYNAGNTTDYGFMISTPTGKAFLRKEGESATREIATKEKDGTSSITLTADAELIGANGVIAVRRGNTVSLRAPIRRKAGSGNLAVLFTLPADMRPVGFTVQQGIVSIDGVSAIFTISTAGEVTIQNATAMDVAGKNFYVTCTYVVD